MRDIRTPRPAASLLRGMSTHSRRTKVAERSATELWLQFPLFGDSVSDDVEARSRVPLYELVTVAGAPGMGSTALALTLARHAALGSEERTAQKRAIPADVLVLSASASTQGLAERLLLGASRTALVCPGGQEQLVELTQRLTGRHLELLGIPGAQVSELWNVAQQWLVYSQKHRPSAPRLLVLDSIDALANESLGARHLDVFLGQWSQLARDYGALLLCTLRLPYPNLDERPDGEPLVTDLGPWRQVVTGMGKHLLAVCRPAFYLTNPPHPDAFHVTHHTSERTVTHQLLWNAEGFRYIGQSNSAVALGPLH